LFKAAEAAAILKVRYFVIHPGPENSQLPDHERFWRFSMRLRFSIRPILTAGTWVSVWCWRTCFRTCSPAEFETLLWILGALDTFKVGFAWTQGTHTSGEDLPAVVHKLSGHLWMVHANDNHRHYDDTCLLETETINWAPFLTISTICISTARSSWSSREWVNERRSWEEPVEGAHSFATSRIACEFRRERVAKTK